MLAVGIAQIQCESLSRESGIRFWRKYMDAVTRVDAPPGKVVRAATW